MSVQRVVENKCSQGNEVKCCSAGSVQCGVTKSGLRTDDACVRPLQSLRPIDNELFSVGAGLGRSPQAPPNWELDADGTRAPLTL